MTRMIAKLFAGGLLVAFSSPSWGILIVGGTDPVNNRADLTFSTSATSLTIDLENTSNFAALITGFGFSLSGATLTGLTSVSGTLQNTIDGVGPPFDGWRLVSGLGYFILSGPNLNGGDPQSAIPVGNTGRFVLAAQFSGPVSISDIVVRFQQTGPDGSGSDRGTVCTVDCGPPTTVPEPSALGLLGLGLLGMAGLSRRRLSGLS